MLKIFFENLLEIYLDLRPCSKNLSMSNQNIIVDLSKTILNERQGILGAKLLES